MLKSELDTVLRLVNQARENMGLKALKNIPKGSSNNAGLCPIARGLGNTKNRKEWAVYSGGVHCVAHEKLKAACKAWKTRLSKDGLMLLPDVIKLFIQEFDVYALPKFIDK